MEDTARRAALKIAKTLRGKGLQALFAGGCVRDLLLGIKPEDYDIATNATPGQVRRLFKRTLPIGERFGVVTVLEGEDKVEVTTFRSEGPYTDGRRPEHVTFTSAKEDVLRRDFTVNALLMDPQTGDVLDYVGGQEDMKRRLIRAVGDPRQRFAEDHLRVLRAVRFAARLGYDVEEATRQAVTEMAGLVVEVSGERIRNELERILTHRSRARAVRLMEELGLLKHLLPEVAALRAAPNFTSQAPMDVFEHTVAVLDLLREPSFVLGLAALLHDVGKEKTYAAGPPPRFLRHELVGEQMARDVCGRLRTSAEERETVCWLVRNHLALANARKMRLSRLKRLFAENHFEDLAEICRADSLASFPGFVESEVSLVQDYTYAISLYRSLPPEEIAPPPLVNGNDLIAMGMEPGPIFGELLEEVRDAELEGKLESKEDGLELVRKLLRERGISLSGGEGEGAQPKR